MLALVGIPQSGIDDLVYRNWQDGQYPAGDIPPDEWATGVTASDKQFDYGMGPACTGLDAMGGVIGQAIASPRVVEVCQSLDGVSSPLGCCVESVCDAGYESAFACLAGLVTAG
jgi:hypothetical protein